MADEDLRELERRWAEGQGDLAAGEAFSRALERAGVDTGRRLEVRLQVLRAHMRAAGLGHLTLGPQPELDPMAASFLIPGEDAFRAWHALRTRTEASGAYPLILGAERLVELTIEAIHERPELRPDHLLAQAARVVAPSPAEPIVWDDALWPREVVTTTELASTRDSMRVPLPGEDSVIRVALLPTRTPWHAAAYLRLGLELLWIADSHPLAGPEDHLALHRSWFDRYAAEPVAMTLEVIEFVVGKPPVTRKAAVQLAAEQALYRGTSEQQGPLEDRAARLLGATVWTIWNHL